MYWKNWSRSQLGFSSWFKYWRYSRLRRKSHLRRRLILLRWARVSLWHFLRSQDEIVTQRWSQGAFSLWDAVLRFETESWAQSGSNSSYFLHPSPRSLLNRHHLHGWLKCDLWCHALATIDLSYDDFRGDRSPVGRQIRQLVALCKWGRLLPPLPRSDLFLRRPDWD